MGTTVISSDPDYWRQEFLDMGLASLENRSFHNEYADANAYIPHPNPQYSISFYLFLSRKMLVLWNRAAMTYEQFEFGSDHLSQIMLMFPWIFYQNSRTVS